MEEVQKDQEGRGPLHLKYRPTKFEDVLGNRSVIDSLRSITSRPEDDRPHAFLFQGPSGCGKTTLARILKTELGCSDHDFTELNVANVRGIDTIREIASNCRFAPLSGKCRIYLLDECFSKGTLVNTPNGYKRIEDIKRGDEICSLNGIDSVEDVFANRVDLNRALKLRFSNGKTIYTTKEHLFFTNKGWKEAQCLTNKDLFFDLNETRIRLEGIEIYQLGNNDKSFQGIISDKERDQGYVVFYDLQVKGHPSYFVYGIPVHNCQKLTSDAQNALLKLLEDTPGHVYFILCTTEPGKIIKTIRTRCTTYQVTHLPKRLLFKLLKSVCKAESVELPEEALNKIAEASEGSPRQSLVILDSVIDIPEDQDLLKAIEDTSVKRSAVIDLCRALLNGDSWKKVSKILKQLDDEPENVRYAVLGYMNSVLLNKENDRAAEIIEQFSDSYMYVGKAGLTHSCYLCTKF